MIRVGGAIHRYRSSADLVSLPRRLFDRILTTLRQRAAPGRDASVAAWWASPAGGVGLAWAAAGTSAATVIPADFRPRAKATGQGHRRGSRHRQGRRLDNPFHIRVQNPNVMLRPGSTRGPSRRADPDAERRRRPRQWTVTVWIRCRYCSADQAQGPDVVAGRCRAAGTRRGPAQGGVGAGSASSPGTPHVRSTPTARRTRPPGGRRGASRAGRGQQEGLVAVTAQEVVSHSLFYLLAALVPNVR